MRKITSILVAIMLSGAFSNIALAVPVGDDVELIPAPRNLGINIETPVAKLDVNGTALVRSLITISGGGPQAGYVLTSSNTSGLATWQPINVGTVSNSTINNSTINNSRINNSFIEAPTVNGKVMFGRTASFESFTVNGNVTAKSFTGGNFFGNGAGLVKINGAAVTGTVANATNAVNATNATNSTNATSAINLNGTGTVSGVHDITGVLNFTTGSVTGNINSSGNITSPTGTVKARVFNGSIFNGGVFRGSFVGDGSGITGITATTIASGTTINNANITNSTVNNSTVNNSKIEAPTINGKVMFGRTASFESFTVNGNVTAKSFTGGNFFGNGAGLVKINGAAVTGTVPLAANALMAANATNANNANTANTANTANSATNATNSVNAVNLTGGGTITNTTLTTGNTITGLLTSTNTIKAKVFNGSVFNGGVFRGSFSGDGSGLTGITVGTGTTINNATINNSTITGGTTNNQTINNPVVNNSKLEAPTINGKVMFGRTAKLESFTVNGNVTAKSFTGGNFFGNGAGLTKINGASVTGTVANATNAVTANSATTATTATSATSATNATNAVNATNATNAVNLTGTGTITNTTLTTGNTITGLLTSTNTIKARVFNGSVFNGGVFRGDGSGLTGITATTVSTGTTINNPVINNSKLEAPTINGKVMFGRTAKLESFIVNGSVTAKSFIGGNFFGNGAGLTKINGASVTGTVANATNAVSAMSATIAGSAATATNATNAVNLTGGGTITNTTITTGNTITGLLTSNNTIKAKVFNGSVFNGGVFRGDGSGLTGITATTVSTGTTINSVTINSSTINNPVVNNSKLEAPTINGKVMFGRTAKLESFTVNGNVTAKSFTGGNFFGNGAGLTKINASAITGTINATNFSGSLSGDVTGTQSATVIANSAVTSAKILDGTIVDADVGSLSATKITSGNLPNAVQVDNGSLAGLTSNALLYTNASSKVTTDASKVSVNSSGNVGIGINSATQKLEVVGTVKATAFNGDGSQLTGVKLSATPSYDSGWFAVNKDSYYSKAHTLTSIPLTAIVLFKASANSTNIYFAPQLNYDSGVGYLMRITPTSFDITTGNNNVALIHSANNNFNLQTVNSGYYRIIVGGSVPFN